MKTYFTIQNYNGAKLETGNASLVLELDVPQNMMYSMKGFLCSEENKKKVSSRINDMMFNFSFDDAYLTNMRYDSEHNLMINAYLTKADYEENQESFHLSTYRKQVALPAGFSNLSKIADFLINHSIPNKAFSLSYRKINFRCSSLNNWFNSHGTIIITDTPDVMAFKKHFNFILNAGDLSTKGQFKTYSIPKKYLSENFKRS